VTEIVQIAPWLDKRGIAEHLVCSVRSIETAVAEGMPHAVIFGRVKFQIAEVESWLADAGYLQRRGATTLVATASEEGSDGA
jgi:hypothetical protein